MRSLTIEAWATVKDSVAPNEYSAPTNVVSPGQDDEDRRHAREDDE